MLDDGIYTLAHFHRHKDSVTSCKKIQKDCDKKEEIKKDCDKKKRLKKIVIKKLVKRLKKIMIKEKELKKIVIKRIVKRLHVSNKMNSVVM